MEKKPEKRKRHKCHLCGAVRKESKMRKLDPLETNTRSQFGNNKKCWACKGKCWRTWQGKHCFKL